MKYEDRSKRVRDSGFFPKTLEIHWLSIINSMVLVFLLIGFVVIILVSSELKLLGVAKRSCSVCVVCV